MSGASRQPKRAWRILAPQWHLYGIAMAPFICHDGAMELSSYIEELQRQLAVAANAGGDEARVVAERLIAPLDAAIRLTLLDVLAAAAEEITTDLAPGSVQVRLRGREPEFVVTPAVTVEDLPEEEDEPAGIAVLDGDDGAISRINLRMPDRLKARIEQAAAGEGLSVNAWLVRAAAARLEQPRTYRQRTPRATGVAQRYTGWAR